MSLVWFSWECFALIIDTNFIMLSVSWCFHKKLNHYIVNQFCILWCYIWFRSWGIFYDLVAKTSWIFFVVVVLTNYLAKLKGVVVIRYWNTFFLANYISIKYLHIEQILLIDGVFYSLSTCCCIIEEWIFQFLKIS